MKTFQIWLKIYLLFFVTGCSDNFPAAYRENSTLRQSILSETGPSADIEKLINMDIEGVCIIEYVVDPKHLPTISGVQLTQKEVYIPPGDQYINLIFWNQREWRQVVFKSSELQIAYSLQETMSVYNYCKKGKRINLFKTPFQQSTFTTIVAIEG
jgi:hypothetical protein